MTRLPAPGSDRGVWGDVLNDFLLASHTSNGDLKAGIVKEQDLSIDVQTKLNIAASAATTNLSTTTTSSTVTIVSDSGTSAVVNSASNINAGVLTATDKTKLDGIASGAQVNVGTNLTSTTASNSVTVLSDTGTDAIITSATGSNAGVLTATDKTKLDGIASGAQVNVGTNITATTSSSSVTILSDTGTDAVISSASNINAGVLTATDKTKLDGIEVGAQVNTVTSVATRTGAIVLTKADVGLANVDNTSDLAKPISTLTQSALDGKAPLVHTHVTTDITSGVFGTAYLGTGTATASTYLRGDGTWSALPDTTHVAINNITAAYTLVLGDDSKAIEITVSSAVNLTVPSSASVNFPIGTVIEIVQAGSGQVILVPGGGVTLRSPGSLTTRTLWSTIGLRKRATDEWVVSGDLV
jgi:hypothetical protein